MITCLDRCKECWWILTLPRLRTKATAWNKSQKIRIFIYFKYITLETLGTSLVVQCLRIHVPMQGTWVWALVWEDLTCCRAPSPMHHSYQARALGPVTLQLLKPRHPRAYRPRLLSSCSTTTEACVPRACAQQQEMPLQWETYALQQGMGLSATGESLSSNENLTQPKIK